MKHKKAYIIMGIILFFCSLYLAIGGVLINRLEFTLYGFVAAFGCGECIRRHG